MVELAPVGTAVTRQVLDSKPAGWRKRLSLQTLRNSTEAAHKQQFAGALCWLASRAVGAASRGWLMAPANRRQGSLFPRLVSSTPFFFDAGEWERKDARLAEANFPLEETVCKIIIYGLLCENDDLPQPCWEAGNGPAPRRPALFHPPATGSLAAEPEPSMLCLKLVFCYHFHITKKRINSRQKY